VDLWTFKIRYLLLFKITVLSTLIHALSTGILTPLLWVQSTIDRIFQIAKPNFTQSRKNFFHGKKIHPLFETLLCGAGIKMGSTQHKTEHLNKRPLLFTLFPETWKRSVDVFHQK
jgi:hypothetical protein